jgi:thioredoxin 1
MSVLILHDGNFDSEVKKAQVPMLVDFWATWCGPCKAVAPILEELATELEGKVIIAKMDVDENQATPANFGIRSIPNMVIIKNGAEVGRIVGARPKSELKSALAPFIQAQE